MNFMFYDEAQNKSVCQENFELTLSIEFYSFY